MAQVGEGGVTSGIDLSSLTGRYLLNEAETEAKVKREAEAAAAREARKLERKRQKAALQSAGLSGLRSASASHDMCSDIGFAESRLATLQHRAVMDPSRDYSFLKSECIFYAFLVE